MTDEKDPLDDALDTYASLLKKLDAAMADAKVLEADLTKSLVAHGPAGIPAQKVLTRVADLASAIGPSRTNAMALVVYGAIVAFKTGFDVEAVKALAGEAFEASAKLKTMQEAREAYPARNAEAHLRVAAAKESQAPGALPPMLVPGNGQVH